MALEAVVFPQDVLGHGCNDLHSLAAARSSCDFDTEQDQQLQQAVMASSSSSPEACTAPGGFPAATARRKRRRTRTSKKEEEVENQRMTHIAVERNRRRQMNEYLGVLRSLMPASYVQKGDQATIIGGAINFVKELELLLKSLEARKRMTQDSNSSGLPCPFAGVFTFPQLTTTGKEAAGAAAENPSAIADIEATMVGSHVSLKIFSKKRPKQLLKMVLGLQGLRLTILHLNVTTIHPMALYSFNLRVEDNCNLASMNEIATAVYQLLGKIEEDSNRQICHKT